MLDTLMIVGLVVLGLGAAIAAIIWGIEYASHRKHLMRQKDHW